MVKREVGGRTIGIPVAFIALLVFLTVFILLADFDRDGLRNMDEFRVGTNIFNPDTDGDGLLDGIEVNGSWHFLELKQSPSNSYSFAWTLEHSILNGQLPDPILLAGN